MNKHDRWKTKSKGMGSIIMVINILASNIYLFSNGEQWETALGDDADDEE